MLPKNVRAFLVKTFESLEAGHPIQPNSEAHAVLNEIVPRIGQQRDIVVTINHSLEEYDIGFVQQIEKQIDDALGHIGFSRSTTTKGDTVELVYFQFAFAQKT